jgi:hypothetical protein
MNDRHILQRKLHCNFSSIPFLLSNPSAVIPLLKYVHSTGHFKDFCGKDKDDKTVTNTCRNAEIHTAFEELDARINPSIKRNKDSFHLNYSSILLGEFTCISHTFSTLPPDDIASTLLLVHFQFLSSSAVASHQDVISSIPPSPILSGFIT